MRVSYANRGMAFERLINITNQQYYLKGKATIQKVATPWKVIRRGKKIISAFPETKSTVDYIGVYNSRAVAFDAKSTRVNTRFDLSLIDRHQYEFLKRWQQNGGIAFILIEFVKKHEFFLLNIDQLTEWWEKAESGGRKSIPYDWISNNCKRVISKNGVVLDYLSIIK